jgi:hypothetical protein
MGQKAVNAINQLWNWLIYEFGVHPFIFAGIVIIIISAWLLYKAEVRTK